MTQKESKILIKLKRDPLGGKKLSAILKQIKTTFKNRAIAGYLFGSFATEKFNKYSDIDIIIIAETNIPFIKRPFLFDEIYNFAPSIDLLVYTPSEFKILTTNPSAGFWRLVCKQMKRIF